MTDTVNAAIYVVSTAAAGTDGGAVPAAAAAARRVPLTGNWDQSVDGFHANGIEYSAPARSLVAVQSVTGLLFAVGWDGVATRIPLAGGGGLT